MGEDKISACPHCGDTKHGFRYVRRWSNEYAGIWGESAEVVDMTTADNPPKNATCRNCNRRVPLRLAEGSWTAEEASRPENKNRRPGGGVVNRRRHVPIGDPVVADALKGTLVAAVSKVLDSPDPVPRRKARRPKQTDQGGEINMWLRDKFRRHKQTDQGGETAKWVDAIRRMGTDPGEAVPRAVESAMPVASLERLIGGPLGRPGGFIAGSVEEIMESAGDPHAWGSEDD